MQLYVQDKAHKPAPRLPDITELHFKPLVNDIRKVLISLRNVCLSTSSSVNRQPCEGKSSAVTQSTIDNLLIFDNSSVKMELIYAHDKSHIEHSEMVEDRSLSDIGFSRLVDQAFFIS